MSDAAFPPGFVWGTATAAHQVESGNWNNDWWAWEHRLGTNCADPSGDACDHYHRYREDIALPAGGGFAETSTIERFLRFTEQVGLHLDDLVNRWCTFNEPDIVATFGYLAGVYWSLLDNFEWLLGYRPTFGLVEVDRATQLRTVKPSGHWLGRVARANALVP